MIRVRATGKDGQPMLLVCIDRNNLERMIADWPLQIDLTDFEDCKRVAIAYKENLEDFVGELITAGMAPPGVLEEIQDLQPGETRSINLRPSAP